MSAEVVQYINRYDGHQIIGAVALDDAIERGEHPGDILHLGEIITEPNVGTLVDIDCTDKHPRGSITREEAIVYGKWIGSVLRETDGEARITEKVLVNAYRIGLGRGLRSLCGKFGGAIWQYQDALGESNNYSRGRYSHWTTRDFVEYGQRVANGVHRKPITSDFQRWFKNGRGPSPAYLRNRLGGIDTLQELLGFPNIYDWTEEDYLSYGVRVIRANPDRKITREIFDTLSKRKRGPSTRTLVNKFGSLSNYKTQIFERSEADDFEQSIIIKDKLNQADELIAEHGLESELRIDNFANNEAFIAAAAKIKVLSSFRHFEKPTKIKVANSGPAVLISTITNQYKGMTAAHVEVKALALDCFDDIWPMNEYMKFLRVNKSSS